VPSSFASSWTRGFATSLLSGSSRAGRTASGSRSSHLTAHDRRFESSSGDTHYTESIRSTCFLWSLSTIGTASGPGRPGLRSAAPKARFARAFFQHAAESWIQAPRPGRLRSASTTIRSSSARSTASRSSCGWGSLRRQAMHIRIGSRGARTAVDTGPVYSTARAPPSWARSVPVAVRRRARRVSLRRCRSSNWSVVRPGGRSAPPCRSPGTAGPPAPWPGRTWRPRRGSPPSAPWRARAPAR